MRDERFTSTVGEDGSGLGGFGKGGGGSHGGRRMEGKGWRERGWRSGTKERARERWSFDGLSVFFLERFRSFERRKVLEGR